MSRERLKKVDKDNKKHISIVYTFTKEKLDEFKDMTIRQRLEWLEEANIFINRTIGFKKRALTDARFEGDGVGWAAPTFSNSRTAMVDTAHPTRALSAEKRGGERV